MERSAPAATLETANEIDTVALLERLRACQYQVASIGYPKRDDLVGRELELIDRALRRLLRELGDRDSVDA